MFSTPYLAAISGFSSMLTFTISSESACSAAIWSRIGAIIRQGPHHGAQKSTRTGFPLSSTSFWKDASVTCLRFDMGSSSPVWQFLLLLLGDRLGGCASHGRGAVGQ